MLNRCDNPQAYGSKLLPIQGVREKHRNIQTAVIAKHNKQLSLSKDFVILTKKITNVGLMQEKGAFLNAAVVM